MTDRLRTPPRMLPTQNHDARLDVGGHLMRTRQRSRRTIGEPPRPWEAYVRNHSCTVCRATPFEIVVMVCVVAAVAAFEIWFFFFSPSPIDQRSGR